MANFDYTNRDYSTIKNSLLERAGRSIPDWTDRDPSDFMSSLIDLWAYSADILHYYIDRASTEAFLETATQRSSILALANLYGYVPNHITAAKAYVNVTTGSASVSVPAGTTFNAQLDSSTIIPFYTETSASVPASSTVSFLVTQGVSKPKQAVIGLTGNTASDGKPSQRFSFYDKNINIDTVRVFVGEGVAGADVEWSYVTRLTVGNSSSSIYTIQVLPDGTNQIVFGNGVDGRIPPVNAQISASYSTCLGASGNVGAGTIRSIGSNSFPQIRTISNPNAAFGGSDQESIEDIRRAIPSVLRSNNRAISLSDFNDLARGVSGVSKAVAQYTGASATGASVTINAIQYQADYLTSATAASTTLAVDEDLRNRIINEITPAAMLGVTFITVPSTVSVQPVYISLTVNVLSNYIRQNVATKVQEAIEELFIFDNVSFGQTLTLGDIYRAALAVEGVDYIVVTRFNTASATVLLGSITATTAQLLKLVRPVSITSSGGISPVVA